MTTATLSAPNLPVGYTMDVHPAIYAVAIEAEGQMIIVARDLTFDEAEEIVGSLTMALPDGGFAEAHVVRAE